MRLVASEKIKCAVSEETQQKILESLEEEFKKVSQKCELVEGRNGDAVKAEMISATFGSINRTDVSTITVDETRKKDGYTISVETEYKPSILFFAFIGIGVITCVVGAVVPVGMYFYNKTIVEKSIADVLKRVKDEVEE